MRSAIRHTPAAPAVVAAPSFRIVALLRTWIERIRARRMLASVDERTLRELGIAPAAAGYEARQPFWRPLRDLRR